MTNVFIYPKLIQLICLCVCIHTVSFSQNRIVPSFKRCSIKTINYEQGLLNNGTTNIITDALGFTWVSTKTGMQRYNGYVLETINPVINKEIIRINSPVYFFALKTGLIWISYKQGVLEYDPHKNAFKKIISLPTSGNLNFSLVPVAETNEGIWCMQHNKGLVIYSLTGAIKKVISETGNSFPEAVFNQQQSINNTAFALNQNLIFFYNGTDQIQQINLHTHQINNIRATNIFSFTCSNTNLYIVSNSGLTRINIDDQKISIKVSFKNILGENINSGSLLFLDNNLLLVGLNSHLYEVDTACNYQKEFANLNRNPVVALGYITTIYADRFKRIWLLTNDDIKRIQNIDIPFEHFIYANEENNFVRSLYYDEQKHVLLSGCLNGGIQLYDTSGNALWKKSIITENVKDVLGIEKLTANKFLLITFGKGWYILNLPLKHLELLKIPGSIEEKLQSHSINYSNNLYRINDSTVLISTSSNVFRCVFKNETILSAQPLLPFTDGTNSVDCFIYSANKKLWVGTAAGLVYVIDRNKNIQTIHIPDNYLVRSFAEDAQHNIWVGTDKGLYVYNSYGRLVKTITAQTGLQNDCIYALVPVENKTAVFASSNLGLSYVSLNGNIINYTKESGLQENEFNTQSALKTAAGKFYFGGVNGITSFYPASLSNIKDTPLLNLTKLIINDSSYNTAPGYWKGDSISLSYSQNHLQFNFAAIGLLNTNEYVYKYRLKSFETNLQTTHQPTGIKYVLEPGSYTFEISCAPIFSSDNILKKSISIIILPPWWQTWWFRILMVAALTGIIAFIVQQYLKRRYQEKLRVLQLQQQIQHERERISRDLHDNLGAYAAAIASNVATIQTAHNSTEKNILHQLTTNSQSIINQLNDTIWALNKEAISLTAVSDRFKVFLQKIQPNYPNINIQIEEHIIKDEKLSPANALHLFRILQEAVSNALRHSSCNNIFIKIVSADTWKITVEDDGSGINILPEKSVSGNGLKNIKMRSEQAGWQVSWVNAKPQGTGLIISSTPN